MSKLDKRALSILVIASFLMSMIPTIVVSAAPGDVTNVPWAPCTSVWSTYNVKVGIYSLHVEMPDAGGAWPDTAGRVDTCGVDIVAWLPDGITLAELTEVKVWEYIVTPGDTAIEIGAAIILNMDMDDDGIWDGSGSGDADAQIILDCPFPSAAFVIDNIGKWDERDAFTDGYSGWDKGGGQLNEPSGDLAHWKTTAYSTYDVIGVGVVVGWGYYGSYDGYFDDFTVNGVTYPITLDVPLPPTGDFSIDYVSSYVVDYDDTLTVTGSGVTAGSEVKVFWDYASGTYAHLLNTTEGNPDGTFDLEVDVPSDVGGAHYLWATDVSTGETVSSPTITMVPRVRLLPSSGLKGDDVDVKGYGFGEEKVVSIKIDTWDVTGELVGTGAVGRTVFNLDYFPVVTDTLEITGTAIGYTFDEATGQITFTSPPYHIISRVSCCLPVSQIRQEELTRVVLTLLPGFLME